MKLKICFLLCFMWMAQQLGMAQTTCSSLVYKTPFVSTTGTGPYTFTVFAGTGLSYQWYSSPTGLAGSWIVIPGATSSSYLVTSSMLGSFYFVKVTCVSTGIARNSCVLTPSTGACASPLITVSKPLICPLDSVLLTSSITDDCNLYQWQDSLSGDIAGATAATFSIAPPITTTHTYRLKLTCTYGISYSAWVRVVPYVACDTPLVSISKITSCAGDSILLKATGTAPCATLQWEDSLTGAIAGAHLDSLRFIAPSFPVTYRLKATCPLGSISYSKWINFRPITCDSPVVSISAIGGCTGDSIVLKATGITPCAILQWEDSLSGTIVGAHDSMLHLVAGATRHAYRLITKCPLGKVYYSDWLGFTPYATCADSVWAGDVNWDLKVDYLDLLDLGVAYGATGYARISPSISWFAQYAKNWPRFYPSTVNYKHADCDGNGIVNDDDTMAIYTNYSLVHTVGVIIPKRPKITGLPDLYFDLSGLSPKAGDVIKVPIKLGTSANPVPLIYGIATQIYLDGIPSMLTPMDLDYTTTWIGIPKYKLKLVHSPSANQLDAVYVRKDNNNTAGYGTIGILTLQVPPSTPDKSMMRFHFLSAKVIDKDGNELNNYNMLDDSIMIQNPSAINERLSPMQKVYAVVPNPNNGMFYINCTTSASVTSIKQTETISVKIYDMLGRLVYSQMLLLNKQVPIQLNAAKGMYSIEIQNADGAVQREKLVLE